ncbi:MAG: biotin--[acetyl-CoA-carboxylase] ligase [Thermoleophilaceae bacterium]|jgi:BirA family transcriptional regulator, biotin operon repressor / biotin---[acetyl-CoA-carboxylase] ligase
MRTRSVGTPRAHFRTVDSTNEQAKALALDGAPHGTLVTADEQTAGRGRQGRVWTAPPRSSLLMSLLLRELDERHALLPLAAAVAVCEALEPLECRVKWPNDVWIDGRKLAGILLEGRPQDGWAVLGIGLNVNLQPEDLPEELRETATSIAAAAGEPRDLEDQLAALLRSLDAWIGASQEAVLAAWRERDAIIGRQVSWDGGEGRAAGIDDSGALLVETLDGLQELNAGEIHISGLP